MAGGATTPDERKNPARSQPPDRVSLLLPLHLGEMRSDFDNCLKVFGIEEVIGNLLELSLISKISQMVVFLALGISTSNLLEMLYSPSDASGSQR